MALTQVDQGMLGTNAQYTGFKNRIINGAMVIDQRNAGAAVTASSSYPVDRFQMTNTSDGAFSAQQDSSAPSGFVNSVKVTTTTADATLTTTQRLTIRQIIEGTNISDLAWGTASAKTVTMSFWVRSSLTGTFGGSLQNGAGDRSYPFTYSISVADTWEYKTVTILGDTSGTWLTTTGRGINVFFGLGAGPDTSGTAGAWASAGYTSATGAVSVVGTNGATFYITGVQLEKGSTATSFDYRPYTTELQLCQRYFEMSYPQGTAPGTTSQQTTALSVYNNSPTASTAATMTIPVRFKVSKRASPTVTIYQPITGATGFMRNYDTGATITSSVFLPSQEQCSLVTLDGSNGCTSNQPLVGHFTASAEL